jgi:hypothetical protein
MCGDVNCRYGVVFLGQRVVPVMILYALLYSFDIRFDKRLHVGGL